MRAIDIIKDLIKLLQGFIKEDRDKAELNGLYIKNETPRVFGTKIRRFY